MIDEEILDELINVVQLIVNQLWDTDGNLIIGGPAGPTSSGQSSVSLNSGNTTVFQVDKALYKSAFIDYIVYNTLGQRSGQIVISNFGNNIDYTEVTTNDLGSGSENVFFSVSTNLTTFDLIASAPNNSYNVKIFYRYI